MRKNKENEIYFVLLTSRKKIFTYYIVALFYILLTLVKIGTFVYLENINEEQPSMLLTLMFLPAAVHGILYSV